MRKFSLQGLFLLCSRWNFYQSAFTDSLLYACTIITYLRVTLGKNRFKNSLVQHLKKIMNILKASIFNFVISNLVKNVFRTFTLLQPLLMHIWRIDSSLGRALWRKVIDTLKALILTIIVPNLVSEGHCHISRILYGIVNLQFLT